MLSVLTVVHEWGHFIVARIFKIRVNEFSIFMGPKLFQRKTKKTGMLFSVRALPVGGYCALEGETDEVDDDGRPVPPAKDSFVVKPWYVRALVLLAGVTMNYILALLIVSVLFCFNGYDTRKVSAVSEDAPMMIAGLEPGDTVLGYNGKTVTTPMDYSLYSFVRQPEEVFFTVRKKNGEKVRYSFVREFDVKRNDAENASDPGTVSAKVGVFRLSGKNYSERTQLGTYTAYWDNGRALTVTLDYSETGARTEYFYGVRDGVKGAYVTEWDNYSDGAAGNSVMLHDLHQPSGPGAVRLTDEEYVDAFINEFAQFETYSKFGFSFTYGERGNFFSIVGNSFLYVHSLIKSVFMSLWFLISGQIGLNALAGPIGLTKVVNQVVTVSAPSGLKIASLAEMTALISANLAVINLLPFPGLDGGKLLFIVIELIRGGKKVSPKVEGILTMIFFGLLILLAIVVAGNDIFGIISGR